MNRFLFSFSSTSQSFGRRHLPQCAHCPDADRRLKKTLEHEPDYLTTHREDVANIIIGFLAGSGLQWHREIFEREWLAILRDSLARLSAKKR